MTHVQLTLSITAHTPLFVGSGFGVAGIIDAKTVRNSGGSVYIPASTIKGRLKSHYRKLAMRFSKKICGTGEGPRICILHSPCVVCKLFGSQHQEGNLFFSDARLLEDYRRLEEIEEDIELREEMRFLFELERRTNVRISRPRRVAKEEQLFTSELAAKGLSFTSEIWGDFEPERPLLNGSIPQELALLVGSIKLMTHIGGRKSRGSGRCNFYAEKILVDNDPVDLNVVLQGLKEM